MHLSNRQHEVRMGEAFRGQEELQTFVSQVTKDFFDGQVWKLDPGMNPNIPYSNHEIHKDL